MLAQARTPLAKLRMPSFKFSFGWEEGIFAFIVLAALGLRLWELGGRTMHYDESLHVHYAWRLAIGEGYSHSPWMHGPFQVDMTAIIFKLFSDTDFTARMGYAFFGAALVGLPYFFRSHIGRTGALTAALLLALSPSLLYFSRFGRNEILMAFWSVSLLILMWRYMSEGKNRYLYLSSAVLAFAFATKETAYFIVGIFGIALFFMSITELVPWLFGRIKLRDLTGPAVLLLLVITLSLPQWSAIITLLPGGAGIDLVQPPAVGEGGLPIWGAPFVIFPVIDLPQPVNWFLMALILIVPLGLIKFTYRGRRWWRLLIPVAVIAALAYGFFAFPSGLVARGYLISLGVLLATLLVSIGVGLFWRWKVWLLCAGIFYLIWSALYTSFFGLFVTSHGFCRPDQVGSIFGTICGKLGGLYTGSWQGLSYWLTQQEVARGGQPWYYHLMLGSVYEFIPLLFGIVAVIYYLRKGDLLGQMLAFWAVSTLFLYSYAGEKMPWLIVNVTVPFILLSAKFIGEMVDRVTWRQVLRSSPIALMLLAPLFLLGGVYLLHLFLKDGSTNSWPEQGTSAGIAVLALAGAFLLWRTRNTRVGLTMASLGVGILLLGFSTYVAFRASYQFDDSPVELLIYAQGSADLVRTVDGLGADLLTPEQDQRVVDIDYELWYPINWYVRTEQKDGTLGFKCYKDEDEDGYASYCNTIEEEPSTGAVLLNESHSRRDSDQLTGLNKQGPFFNLLWFPELYRRPGENRREEGMVEEFKSDVTFFKDTFTERESVQDMLDYFLFRRLGSDWWNSKYYSYTSTDVLSPPVEEPG